MESNRNKCHYCICKTCAIAEVNGGAPGCGNCEDCDLIDGCRSCNEYYNPEPHINDIINQVLEYNYSSSNLAYVLRKDKNGKIKIKTENMDNFIEGEEGK